MSQRSSQRDSLSPLKWGFAAILVITLTRLILLANTQLQLYPDESQYWVWSQTFDWGYFSKPPLIAWVIASSTTLFGDTDFAIRLPSLVFHAMGAGFLLLSAHHLKAGWAGAWAALIYLSMPGVGISAGIISTDALLLPLWAGALYMLLRLRDQPGRWFSAIGLGTLLGLAFLAKYAAVYFLIGAGLAVVIDPPLRRALASLQGLLAAAILAAIWAPNILWNASHDFATVQHTAANANWQGNLFNFGEFLEFLAGQFGVFGLLLFPVLIAACIQAWRHWRDPDRQIDRLLTLFIVPALLSVLVQSFISRAHANWAASAYVAGSLLVVLFLLRGQVWRRYVMLASIVLGISASAVMAVLSINPALAGGVSAFRGLRHLQSWPETAAALQEAEQQDSYTALVFDDRNIFHQMQRYGPQLETPLRMWQRFSAPHNHAEDVWALENGELGPVLIVSEREWERDRLLADFATVEPLGEISIPAGGHRERRLTLYAGYDYQRIPRTAAYEAAQSAINAARQPGN
ncbi:MAG: glycosyl transferase [Rhodobacterales bacterium CG15_BIG_FIL_POST_REV_8_21_14_020_59_13]|nr:MAG: glycosyl transferase [Rhodobacterales bacterium CG15_BIG_FIL_POST_REV_8_21_14_020_59_13]